MDYLAASQGGKGLFGSFKRNLVKQRETVEYARDMCRLGITGIYVVRVATVA